MRRTMDYLKAAEFVLSESAERLHESKGLTEDQIFRVVEDFVHENSKEWRLPNPQVNYADPFCRMAYVYMNVPIHATLIENAVNKFSSTKTLLGQQVESKNAIKVCAMGGGPGAELLSMVAYLEEVSEEFYPISLDFTLVDLTREWDESWELLKRFTDSRYEQNFGSNRAGWPALFSRSFLPLNAVNKRDFENLPTRFGGVNLFIFSYIASEVKDQLDKFSEVIGFLGSVASKSAQFLFVDRDEREIREGVKEIIEKDSSLQLTGIESERGKIEVDLRKLGDWFANIKPIPRQRWQTFFASAERR